MADTPILASQEHEREELKLVEAGLARTPRLAKLLRFLVENQLDGDSQKLNEYSIATEVFGRKESVFDASEDAIARVEIHRLRKRLNLYYQNEGRNHLIHIVIPAGTYIPTFVKTDLGLAPTQPNEAIWAESSADSSELNQEATVPAGSGLVGELSKATTPPLSRKSTWSGRFRWWHVVLMFVVVSSILLTIRKLNDRRPAVRSATAASPLPLSNLPQPIGPRSTDSITAPFRMIAGYKGKGERDSAGNVWQADQYFQGGWPMEQHPVFVPRTSDQMLFRFGRSGECTYNIPLGPGVYELHLYFLQASQTGQSEESENKVVFSVTLNGKMLLHSFDIVSDAMGRNVADERLFRDVSPAEDGYLHLHFVPVIGSSSISAIAILPGLNHQQIPIRIAAQQVPVTDSDGVLWQADNYVMGGRRLSHNLPSPSLPDDELISSERYGHFSYAIPVDTRDQYTVVLYFVEAFWGTANANGMDPNSRVFRVICNGSVLLDNFNIYKEVGDFHLVKKTFHHLSPTAQGKLNLTFEPISDYATVSAIEVIDESR